MGNFPKQFIYPDPLVTISNFSMNSIGSFITSSGIYASSAYPSANLAIFIPFRIARPMIVTSMFSYNGITASNNIDLGIYSADGTKIVSTGSTVLSGTSVLQQISITSTEIGAGLFYMAVAMNGTSGTLQRQNYNQAAMLQLMGIAQMATAFPLPATATFASMAQTYLPFIGLTGRSVL